MKRYSSPYEIFILILSILSFITVFLLMATQIGIYPSVFSILIVADTLFCVIFIFDFFRSLYLAEHKMSFIKWGWMDLVGSIPFLFGLRIFRLRRVVDATNHLRGMEPGEISEKFRDNPARSTLFLAIVLTIVIVFAASTLIVGFEANGPNPMIDNGMDALWWTLVTITTVGYGDLVPVTLAGRALAVVLMFLGVGLFGVLTSYLASSFAAPIREQRDQDLASIQQDLDEIKGLLNDLKSDRK